MILRDKKGGSEMNQGTANQYNQLWQVSVFLTSSLQFSCRDCSHNKSKNYGISYVFENGGHMVF